MATDGSDLTDEELADLTDGELIELHRFLDAEIKRLRQVPAHMAELGWTDEILDSFDQIRSDILAPTGSTEDSDRYELCWASRRRVESQMNLRLPEMLRLARSALGLTHRDVGRLAGMHSKFVEEIEQGRRGGSGNPRLFERASTEGGLDPARDSQGLLVWFPLADPRLCRTIHEVTVDPAWISLNDGASLSLARTIREGRAFDLLPILGDALEEAGCANASILDHCRNPGLHVLSCWVVDALVRAGRRG